MNNQPKPKRGAQFYAVDLGFDVWLERIVSPDDYFVYADQERKYDSYNIHPKNLIAAKKQRSGISSKPKPLTQAKKEFKKELNVFFASQTLVMPYLCDNCNKPLKAFTDSERRCCIAHILPKNEEHGFPEVAIHPQNKLFLGAKCGCHNLWDNKGADDREKMNCYHLAIERFNQFKHLLSEAKLQKAYDYLNIT